MRQKTGKKFFKRGRVLCMLVLGMLTLIVNGCRNGANESSLEEILSKGKEVGTGEVIIPQDPEEQEEKQAESDSQRTVWVHICGEVEVPGIYELAEGSRVYDGLVLAGGFTIKADTTYYNLAAPVTDGMKIQIPAKEEKTEESVGTGAASDGSVDEKKADAGLININTATSEQLQTLPGIGKSRAADIIAYREKCGGFKDIRQIMEVSGIKEAVYEKIKDLITLN